MLLPPVFPWCQCSLRTCLTVKPSLFVPAELEEDTDLLTTFHLHCKQNTVLKSQLNPMFTHVQSLPGFCSTRVLGKAWKRAGNGCARESAGQRAHGVFIAQKSVPITAPEGQADVLAAVLPTRLALGSRSAHGGADDGHQRLGSNGRPWPSHHAPATLLS